MFEDLEILQIKSQIFEDLESLKTKPQKMSHFVSLSKMGKGSSGRPRRLLALSSFFPLSFFIFFFPLILRTFFFSVFKDSFLLPSNSSYQYLKCFFSFFAQFFIQSVVIFSKFDQVEGFNVLRH